MVPGDMAADDLYAVLSADFPYQISHAYANSTCEYRLSVLRDPYEMVFAIEERVGSFPVELHTLQCSVCGWSILKGSAKAEGFAPKEWALKIETIGGRQWKEQVAAGLQPSIEYTEREIEYNHRQLQEEFLPMYRKMLDIFREGYWLAEPETQKHYGELVEYVEGWNRWQAKGVTPDVMREIGHSESKLKPFYEELANRTEVLRAELSQKS